jgi:DNA-directed RNA polymerase specialized sigma24 family protein
MKPSPAVLTNAYYAFYDLHRPAYHAYAAAHLPTEEARIATSKLFETVASTWTSVVAERCPSAWAWQRFTQTVARCSGRTSTAVKDTHLLHHKLRLSIDQIATVTGTEPATVCAHLATARREQISGNDG